jgi:hypothetical protein
LRAIPQQTYPRTLNSDCWLALRSTKCKKARRPVVNQE